METGDPISLEGKLAQRYRLMEAQWLMVQFARDKSRWPKSTDELSDWVAALATPPLRLTERRMRTSRILI